MKNKLVSIVTPCYNGEKLVESLLESILNQTYPNIELIFVNDGSTDQTEEIVKKYEKLFQNTTKTLKYIRQRNSGQAAAVNNGLKHVEGEFLVWPDSDDWYEKDAIENMVNFLEDHPDYDAVRAKVAFRKDNKEREIAEVRGSSQPENTDVFLNYILEEDTYCFTGMIMIRTKKFFETNKGRDIYIHKAGQNWQIILPTVYQAKTGYIDKIVYHVLLKEGSHSRKKETRLGVLKRMQNHRRILNRTVKKIIENKEEKEKYLKVIKEKYDKREKDYIIYRLRHWNEE